MDLNIEKLLEKRPAPANENPIEIAKQVILRSRLSLMIGYYGDMLFTQNPDAFKKSSCFLFESIGESQG